MRDGLSAHMAVYIDLDIDMLIQCERETLIKATAQTVAPSQQTH